MSTTTPNYHIEDCTCQGLGCDTCCPPAPVPYGPFLWESTTWEDPYDGYNPDDDSEIRAEFAMSWVHGGGDPADASAAYNQHHRH